MVAILQEIYFNDAYIVLGKNPPCNQFLVTCLGIEENQTVFWKCPVDFAGPVYVKSGLCHKNQSMKHIFCALVRFATKTVHLDLVGDLTPEAYLNAFNRFFLIDMTYALTYNFIGDCCKLQKSKKLFV